MNVPAIAKKTFEELSHQTEFMDIVKSVLVHLKKIPNVIDRAKFIHKLIENYNRDVFAHPLVQKLSPCKINCTGCCHTQVSVTEGEAQLLAQKVKNGINIDQDKLITQISAGNSSEAFFQLNYDDRRCVFLNAEGSCRVYEDRPSVCRTNAVLGSADQCDTRNGIQKTVLINTPKSDMVIYASYLDSRSSGALPYMIGKSLGLSQTESGLEDEAM